MDNREKLAELLEEARLKYHVCIKEFPNKYNTIEWHDYFADHLIANGVIVQQCGEWVYDHWCEFKCSICGEFSNSNPYKGTENYCSNCGAKMMPWSPKGKQVDEA